MLAPKTQRPKKISNKNLSHIPCDTATIVTETNNPAAIISPYKMPKPEEPLELTVRGTKRKRHAKRSPAEIGGDPSLEENRLDSKLGGRITNSLKHDFDTLVKKSKSRTQGSFLQEAIKDLLIKYDFQ